MTTICEEIKFSPLTKKIEIDVGYKGYYRKNDSKFEVRVLENGVNVIVDTTSEINLAQIYKQGYVNEYFKPIKGIMIALKFAKTLNGLSEQELVERGFILVSSVDFS